MITVHGFSRGRDKEVTLLSGSQCGQHSLDALVASRVGCVHRLLWPEGLVEAGIQGQAIHLPRVDGSAGLPPTTGQWNVFGEIVVFLEGVVGMVLCLQNSSQSLLSLEILGASSLMPEHQISLGKPLFGNSCEREQHQMRRYCYRVALETR